MNPTRKRGNTTVLLPMSLKKNSCSSLCVQGHSWLSGINCRVSRYTLHGSLRRVVLCNDRESIYGCNCYGTDCLTMRLSCIWDTVTGGHEGPADLDTLFGTRRERLRERVRLRYCTFKTLNSQHCWTVVEFQLFVDLLNKLSVYLDYTMSE